MLRNSDVARMETVLYVTLEVVRRVALLVQPAMPATASSLLDLLGQEEGASREFGLFNTVIIPGTELQGSIPIFPKFEVAPA